MGSIVSVVAGVCKRSTVYEDIHGPLDVTIIFYLGFKWLAFEIVVFTRLSSLAAAVLAYDSVFRTLKRFHPPQH